MLKHKKCPNYYKNLYIEVFHATQYESDVKNSQIQHAEWKLNHIRILANNLI